MHNIATCEDKSALWNQFNDWANREGRGIAQIKIDPGGRAHTFVVERLGKNQLILYQGYVNLYSLKEQAKQSASPPDAAAPAGIFVAEQMDKPGAFQSIGDAFQEMYEAFGGGKVKTAADFEPHLNFEGGKVENARRLT